MILGILFVTALIMVGPQAVADAWANIQASRAGKWDVVEKDRERRSAARARWMDAWQERRRRRSLQAGGDGSYRPGLGAYLKDLYHGHFERRLEAMERKREARGPYVYDPEHPTWSDRLEERLGLKVGDLRRKRDLTLDAPPPAAQPPSSAPPEPAAVPTPTPAPEPVAGEQPPRLYAVPNLAPAPAPTNGAPTEGATTVTTDVVDVTTNEALRQNAAAMRAAGVQLAEALAMAEAAKKAIAAAANASVDGVSAGTFDAGATAAVADVADQISASTLSAWAEIADNVIAGAQAIIDHLAKYQDAEDLVAQTGVDPGTLAAHTS